MTKEGYTIVRGPTNKLNWNRFLVRVSERIFLPVMTIKQHRAEVKSFILIQPPSGLRCTDPDITPAESSFY